MLYYEIYTLVNDHALLVIEHALRDRFIDFHDGSCTFVHRDGREKTTTIGEYGDVYKAAKRFLVRGYVLLVGRGPATVEFNGTLDGLRKWARPVDCSTGNAAAASSNCSRSYATPSPTPHRRTCSLRSTARRPWATWPSSSTSFGVACRLADRSLSVNDAASVRP